MVFIFTGKTGSGKTFQAVKFVFKQWLSGRDIYTNVELLFDNFRKITIIENILYKIKYYLLKLITLNKYKVKRPKRGKIFFFEIINEIFDANNGVIFFDDAGILFNSKSWDNLPIEFVYKLQLHRHHRLDLVATIPNIRSIHIDYRRLVQRWFYCKRFFQIGKEKCYFGIFVRYEKDIDDLTLYEDDILATDIHKRLFFIHYYSKILYDTFADIGFKRYKLIWISHLKKSQAWIIPKELSLKEALTVFSSLRSRLNPRK